MMMMAIIVKMITMTMVMTVIIIMPPEYTLGHPGSWDAVGHSPSAAHLSGLA